MGETQTVFILRILDLFSICLVGMSYCHSALLLVTFQIIDPEGNTQQC